MNKPPTTIEQIIRSLELQPHPEGGYYREVYRSQGTIPQLALPNTFHGDRCYGTHIYYLLCKGEISKLHKIASDEIWHYYMGDPLIVYQMNTAGNRQEYRLGQNMQQGDLLHHVVPAGIPFGAYLPEGSEFALVGCTVTPGFDFSEFEFV